MSASASVTGIELSRYFIPSSFQYLALSSGCLPTSQNEKHRIDSLGRKPGTNNNSTLPPPPPPPPPPSLCTSTPEGDAKRPHKARTSITSGQQDALVEVYSNDPKPSKEIREELAAKTGLEMKVIQTWFQNRRSKEKREATQRAGVLLSSEYPLSSPPLEVVTSVPTTTKSTVPAGQWIITCHYTLS